MPVVRLLCLMQQQRKLIDLRSNGPGFTLPANIGELDPAVTALDLTSNISRLRGALMLYLDPMGCNELAATRVYVFYNAKTARTHLLALLCYTYAYVCVLLAVVSNC